MKTGYIKILRCPACKGKLANIEQNKQYDIDCIEVELQCEACDAKYPIISGIARFIKPEHYSGSFGFQWKQYSKTQYDSYSGADISKKRLFRETKWPEDMRGEIILEAGCGSGRFTENLITTGAMVVSIDASQAVDENFKNNNKDNLLIAQADICNLPFVEKSFDRVLCIGVLQHTPDPFLSFKALVSMVKAGGQIVVDIYDKSPFYKRIFNTRHWVRPITKRMPPSVLYKLVKAYISFMWPLAKLIHKLPFGVKINHKLLIADHISYKKLTPDMQKEWTILDTFDWLSAWYEFPQTKETVEKWCGNLPLKNIEIKYGYGGIELHAIRV